MAQHDGQHGAAIKLMQIYDQAIPNSNLALAAVEALGRCGGHVAMVKINQVYDSAIPNSNLALACVKALGEVGRV